MISLVTGKLLSKDLDRAHVMTSGGVAYELVIPLSAYEALPRPGENCVLHTHLVVKDDGWQLFGFSTPFERRVFQRVLDAKGVGPALAIGLLSALSAERLVRAIREKDIATLQGAPRVGRKKAEQLILDLSEKMDQLLAESGQRTADSGGTGSAADEAIRALVQLGYTSQDAERAVRSALDSNGQNTATPELIKVALAKVIDARR